MSERRRMIVLGCLGVLLAACGGGSGSTGLVTSESAVIDEIRRTGTCDDFDGATYCATDSPDATAPGGQSVTVVSSGVGPTPARTPTPGVGGATASPTPAPAATSTSTGGVEPSATTAPLTPSPAPTAAPSDERTVTAVVDGFDAGAACAVAARPAGSDEAWQTASLVAVDDSGAVVTFPVPPGLPDPLELALLCFSEPPAALPATLATLADADPTVIFVLPDS